MTTTTVLKDVYLFKDLDPTELGVIASLAHENTYAAGEDIFVNGQDAQSLFIIRMGSVKIYSTATTGDVVNIAMLGSHTHFGEIPFLDGGKRSATAQAQETSHVVELSYDKLQEVMKHQPAIAVKIYHAFAHFLATRLRNTLDDLNHAKEVRLRHF